MGETSDEREGALESAEEQSEGLVSAVGDAARDASGKLRDAASGVRGAASDLAGAASDLAHDAGEKVRGVAPGGTEETHGSHKKGKKGKGKRKKDAAGSGPLGSVLALRENPRRVGAVAAVMASALALVAAIAARRRSH